MKEKDLVELCNKVPEISKAEITDKHVTGMIEITGNIYSFAIRNDPGLTTETLIRILKKTIDKG